MNVSLFELKCRTFYSHHDRCLGAGFIISGKEKITPSISARDTSEAEDDAEDVIDVLPAYGDLLSV